MEFESGIKILYNKFEKQYIIKDKDNIVIGHFITRETQDKESKCDIELSFYSENRYDKLYYSLKLILNAAFKDSNIFKVNIVVNTNVDTTAFFIIGFQLEGILKNNEYKKGKYIDNLSFGITRNIYEENSDLLVKQIDTEDVILKSLMPNDAHELTEYYIKNKKYFQQYEPRKSSDFYSVERQKKLLTESQRQFFNGRTIDTGIFFEDKLIGRITLNNIIHGAFKSGMLSFSIEQTKQSEIYIKKSLEVFLEYAFNEYNLHRIEAAVLVENEKSSSLLESLGFKFLGINENYMIVNGIWRDFVIYYLMEEDYES